MPGAKGKSGGRRNEAAERNGRQVGRPPTVYKIPIAAGIPIVISVEAAARLQQRQIGTDAQASPEALVERLIQEGILASSLQAALPWLEEARAMCFNEEAQRGLDQLIAAIGEERTPH